MNSQHMSSKKLRRSQTVHKSLHPHGSSRKNPDSNNSILDNVADKSGRGGTHSIKHDCVKSRLNHVPPCGNGDVRSQKKTDCSLPQYASYYNGRIAISGSSTMGIGNMYNKGPVPVVIPKHRTANSSLASQAA